MDQRRQVQVSARSVTSLPRSFQIEFRATSAPPRRCTMACVTKVERNEPMEFSVRLLIPILLIANFFTDTVAIELITPGYSEAILPERTLRRLLAMSSNGTSRSFRRIHIDENRINQELSLTTKVVKTSWQVLVWPTQLSFLRWPLLSEESF